MHGTDPADRVWHCPRCPLTWSSREQAAECCADDDEPDAA